MTLHTCCLHNDITFIKTLIQQVSVTETTVPALNLTVELI